MTKKLLVRPQPFPDESLLSYLNRLAEDNGCETANDLLSLLPDSANYLSSTKKLRISRIYSTSSNFFYDLAELVQKEPRIIFGLTRFPFEQGKLESTSLLQNHNTAYPDTYKFCVLCLKEMPYHRKIWDLVVLTACPIHKCLLSYICTRCNQPLKKSQVSICKCKCEFDFRETEPIFIPGNELKLIEYIYFLAGMRKSKNAMLPIRNPLINYSLKNFCQIIYNYTNRVFRLYFNERFHLSRLIAKKNLHEMVIRAFTVFDNFPDSYLTYIEEVIESPSYRKISNWFPYFVANYQDIYRANPNSFRLLLYETFNKSISKVLSKTNKKISRASFTFTIDDTELARQLGIESEEIVNLRSIGDITIKTQKTKHGVNHIFSGDAFYRIMFKIRSNKKTNSQYELKDIMNLTQISDYLSEHKIRLHEFLDLVIQGKIKCCSEDYNQHGLHRFLFQKNDIEKSMGSV